MRRNKDELRETVTSGIPMIHVIVLEDSENEWKGYPEMEPLLSLTRLLVPDDDSFIQSKRGNYTMNEFI